MLRHLLHCWPLSIFSDPWSHSALCFHEILKFFFFLKCLSDNNFAKENDECIRNPGNCSNGLSFSLFYWPDYNELDAELAIPNKNLAGNSNFEKEYILSSGGDFGIPGIAIYRQGGTFGALVSTGNQTWVIGKNHALKKYD